jgi:transcription initiation factor IIE alpha subunit
MPFVGTTEPKMGAGRRPGWFLLSNHGKVLLCVACDPEIRVSEIAEKVGIKERAVQRILADLREDKVISSTRHGRRNRYRVNRRQNVSWSPNGRLSVGALVDSLGSS